MIRSAKHDPITVPDLIAFADDDITESILLSGIHGGVSYWLRISSRVMRVKIPNIIESSPTV